MGCLVGLKCYIFDTEIIRNLEEKRIHSDFSHPQINEVDIYDFDPSDLPGLSESDSDEQGWYFFCEPYYKYKKSKRANRRTPGGFWKITGRGSVVNNKRGQVIGNKKILVFYRHGGSSKEVKTDWVMHEFYVKDEKDPRYKKDFVLCFIEKKSKKSGFSTPDDGLPSDSLSYDSISQVTECPYIEVESQQPSSSHRLSYGSGKNITENSFSGVESQPLQTANLVRDPGSLFQESTNSLVEPQPLFDNNFAPDRMNLFLEITYPMVEPEPLQTANLVRDPGSLFRESTNSLVEHQSLFDNNFVPDQMNLFPEITYPMQVDPQLLAELYSTNSSHWLNQSPLPALQLPTNPDQYQGFNSSTYSTGFWEDCNLQDFQFDGELGDAISLQDLEN